MTQVNNINDCFVIPDSLLSENVSYQQFLAPENSNSTTLTRNNTTKAEHLKHLFFRYKTYNLLIK